MKGRTLDSNVYFGPALSAAEAKKMITAKVTASLARGEPIYCVLEDFAKQALMTRHPGIARFLPRHVDTVFTNYVVPINISTQNELEGFIAKLPVFINVGMDGATVNSKQKVSKILEY